MEKQHICGVVTLQRYLLQQVKKSKLMSQAETVCMCVCVCVCLDELISAWRLACQSRVVLSIDPLRHLQQLADAVTGLILGNSRPHRMAGLPNEREEIDGISVFF